MWDPNIVLQARRWNGGLACRWREEERELGALYRPARARRIGVRVLPDGLGERKWVGWVLTLFIHYLHDADRGLGGTSASAWAITTVTEGKGNGRTEKGREY